MSGSLGKVTGRCKGRTEVCGGGQADGRSGAAGGEMGPGGAEARGDCNWNWAETPRLGPGGRALTPPASPADFRIGSRDIVPARGDLEAGGKAKVSAAVRLGSFALAGGAGARSALPGGEGLGARGEASPGDCGGPRTGEPAARAVGCGTLRSRSWGWRVGGAPGSVPGSVHFRLPVGVLAFAARRGAPATGERGRAALARDPRRQRLPGCGPSFGGSPGARHAASVPPVLRSLTLHWCGW